MKIKQIPKWVDRQKEGIIVGGIIGFALFYINSPLLEVLEIVQLPTLSKVGAIVFITATIGALLDSWYRPGK